MAQEFLLPHDIDNYYSCWFIPCWPTYLWVYFNITLVMITLLYEEELVLYYSCHFVLVENINHINFALAAEVVNSSRCT